MTKFNVSVVVCLSISLLMVSACENEKGDGKEKPADDSTIDSKGKLEISNLKVKDNPKSVLSCFVTWTTEVPSTSIVEFGTDGYQFRIRDPEEVTDHSVLVIGMHAASAYQVRAVSETADEEANAETTYTTGELPEVVSVAELGAYDPESTQEGWTLLNLSNMGKIPPPPMVAVMYDMEGQPVWYFINDSQVSDSHGDTPLTLLEDNTITVGATAYAIPPLEIDLAGNVLWEGPPQEPRAGITHDFAKLSDGTYVALREVYQGIARGDMLERFRRDHSVIWQWNVFDYVDWVPLDAGGGDWSHCNSVTVDLTEEIFYLSCRNFSNVFKVSMTGDMEIIWRFGEGGDFAADPSSEAPWFEQQHDPEIQPNGNILVYDNGTADRGFSRVVEYALDTDTMEADIIWEFPGDFDVDDWYRDEWFTNYWGDADRQPNGNTLITAGNVPGHGGSPSRVFEVTPDGDVVWEISLPENGLYRSQRISPPPLIEVIE